MGKWLFAFTLVVAALLALANYNRQNAYLTTCIAIPCFLALASRFAAGSLNCLAIAIAVLTAIIFGSAFMAYGSYYYTFTEPSVGYLVGGGWGSVFASSIVGGIFGSICGLIAVVIYSMVAAAVPLGTGRQDSERVEKN